MGEAEQGGDSTTRYTRDDLIQVEYELTSLALERERKKREEDPDVVAADLLGIDPESVAVITIHAEATDRLAVQLEVLRQLEVYEHGPVSGANLNDRVTWNAVDLGPERIRVPDYIGIPFPAGGPLPTALVLRAWPHKNDDRWHLMAMVDEGHEEAAQAYLDQTLEDARGLRSPYRHKVIEARMGRYGGLDLRPVQLERTTRGDLVLADEIWDAVRRNVDRMLDRMDRLERARLGTNRGLLLAGPPGTGKSALCRAIAHEYAGRSTVTIVSASAGSYLLDRLYERLDAMAPAIVLIEDLDLLVGDREDRERLPLVQFLTVLDGLMTHHSRVITVATTNDPELVDAAATRAARFDQVVMLDMPDTEQRGRILDLYLGPIDHEVDIASAVRTTGGFSPADLREVVRAAVLDADTSLVTDEDVASAIRRRRHALGGEDARGLYA